MSCPGLLISYPLMQAKLEILYFILYKKELILYISKLMILTLKQVFEVNFLGLTINENMDWKNHINKISTTMSNE